MVCMMRLHILGDDKKMLHLSLFRNEFNEFNNARAQMLDSIYHMTIWH